MKWITFFTLFVGTAWCSDLLQEMSLEEKVGQLLMVHFNGETANEDARVLIQESKVGGIIYYNWSNGLSSPLQVMTLSAELQKLAKKNRFEIPLLIAADQEGGVVARLQKGFTCFPGNRALGETKDCSYAKAAFFAMGQELQAVGINMNLAPVVDVNSNPKNPVIGVRSFGDDPELVSAFGKQALEGLKQAGVISTLKHFPGYGDVAVDPHEDLPIIRKSKEELEKIELVPFTKLASFADAIMTAHILVPAFDADHCSTLSEKTLSYLRDTIGFKGVIVADSLIMDGVLKKCHSVEEASIRAFNAGCDLLILGGKLLGGKHAGYELEVADVKRIHEALVAAVKSGRIDEGKLDCAVLRLLALKDRCIQSEQSNCSCIASLKHFSLAQTIASSALEIIERQSIGNLREKTMLVVAPKLLEPMLQNTTLCKLSKSTELYFFPSLAPSKEEIEHVLQRAQSAQILLVCSYNAWKNHSAVAMIEALLSLQKPLILCCLRDPLDADLFPKADLVFKTFSPSVASMQAICDALGKRESL